jgi:hypothetical protein
VIFVEVIFGDKRKRYRIPDGITRIRVGTVVYASDTTWDNLDEAMRRELAGVPVEEGSLYIFEVEP